MDLIDSEAPYPDGCGPDCKGCDPCECGHPYSDHGDGGECAARVRKHDYVGIYYHGCPCPKFDSRSKDAILQRVRSTGRGLRQVERLVEAFRRV